jgi:aconitate hydratase
MGVLPLTFLDGIDRKKLGITGEEVIDIVGLEQGLSPLMELTLVVHRADGRTLRVPVLCRIDTLGEAAYYRHGGILQYVLRGIAKAGEQHGVDEGKS